MSASRQGSKRRLDDMSVEARLQRSRERNREHARRTRQRKKAQLQTLQSRVAELQEEGQRLEEALKDCSAANVLLGLSNPAAAACADSCFKSRDDSALNEAMASSGDEDPASPRAAADRPSSPGGDSAAVVSRSTSREANDDDDDDAASSQSRSSDNVDQAAVATARGAAAARPTIHWKNGYTLDARGERKDLSPEELDKMRRERNRLHAKMTRDRKKVYIETLSRAVTDLEEENRQVRAALAQQLNATVGEPARYLDHLGLDRDDEMLAMS